MTTVRQIEIRQQRRQLEKRQAMRRELWAAQQRMMAELLEREDRRIANLKNQETIGVVK